MDAFSEGGLIANPAMVIVSLGAIVGLFAAQRWHKVAQSVDTSRQEVKGPDKWALKDASILTALALFVICGGFLLGRIIGEF